MDSSHQQEVKTQPQSLQKWNIATKEGMQRLIDYYNNKYPDRPKTKLITFNSFDLNQKLNEIKDQDLPCKIIISCEYKDELSHSEPIILQKGDKEGCQRKIIFLRDCFFNVESIDLQKNFKIVKQKKNSPRTSIQGDFESCHSIAIGTIKHITKEKLQECLKFEDNYTPPFWLLKYSQSLNHVSSQQNEIIKKQRPATALKKEIPNDLTLGQYIDKYKIKKETGEVLQTRIGIKWKKWQEMFDEEDGLKERQQNKSIN